MKQLKYKNREEWLELRRSGIGGSDIAAIMGMNPYRTAGQIWDDKVMGSPDQAPTPDMLRGIRLEPVAADEYQERSGRKLEIVNAIIQSDQNPAFLASVDRLQTELKNYVAGNHQGQGVLEIKVPSTWTARRIAELGLPEYQYIQLQWYLGVTGLTWGSFALLNADRWELKWFDVERDEMVINIAEQAAEKFLASIKAGDRPADDSKVDNIELPAIGQDVAIAIRPEMQTALAKLHEAKQILTEAEALHERAAEDVKAQAGGDYVIYSGDYRLYYQPQAGRKTFDHKALAKKHPEIKLDPFFKVGKPSRPLRLFKIGG